MFKINRKLSILEQFGEWESKTLEKDEKSFITAMASSPKLSKQFVCGTKSGNVLVVESK